LELTDSIQSSHSHSEPVSPSRTGRRTSVLVSGSNRRIVWWSQWANESAVTRVLRRTSRRLCGSFQVSAIAWNSAVATTSLPTLPTFCV